MGVLCDNTHVLAGTASASGFDTTVFTAGLWVNFGVGNAGSPCTVEGASSYIVFIPNISAVGAAYFDGTTVESVTLSVVPANASWLYMLIRRNANIFALSTIVNNGYQSGTAALAATNTTVTKTYLGGAGPNYIGQGGFTASAGALVAEYFSAPFDVEPGSGAVSQTLTEQLAYQGPFSLPHLVPNIYEYQSLRSHLPPATNRGETFVGAQAAIVSYTNSGLVPGIHPPLSPTYVRPGQNKTMLIPV
jgi:hypothetical protein